MTKKFVSTWRNGIISGYLIPEDVLYFLNKVKEWKPEN